MININAKANRIKDDVLRVDIESEIDGRGIEIVAEMETIIERFMQINNGFFFEKAMQLYIEGEKDD